ncbi:glucosamine-6-phosphate isomerase [Macrococcus equipercicus]|uniref:Glucosamine-6-phosphate isomerase n=1 Tax=Macrococcus equipercicus TaxID=69967 RepID=A0ABQ6R7W6_9STAP|nr:glucosamine-6-phosphate isomerase [Macrococcus equipercicus]KAA1039185.1 glucosamine-6-phosphate isomerase [Macrococcus equipercicus]
MAMNFKIFDSKGIAAKYAADLVRKQMNNNPTSIIAFAMNDEQDFFYRALIEDVTKNPVDASQIHVFDYDKNEASFKQMGIVTEQLHKADRNGSLQHDVKKVKTKENKGKLTMLVTTFNADGSIGYREVNADNEEGLLTAREVIVLVTGPDKAKAVKRLYETAESQTTFEAANLKGHRMVTVILDNEAAQGLPADIREYYRSLFS